MEGHERPLPVDETGAQARRFAVVDGQQPDGAMLELHPAADAVPLPAGYSGLVLVDPDGNERDDLVAYNGSGTVRASCYDTDGEASMAVAMSALDDSDEPDVEIVIGIVDRHPTHSPGRRRAR